MHKKLLMTLAMSLTLSLPTQAGSISGTVRDPDGAGIGDITVTAWRKGFSLWFGTQKRTPPTGQFSFNDLADGTYRVEFMDDGDGVYAHQTYDSITHLTQGADITVSPGFSTNLNVTLQYARVISGRIIGPDGMTGLSNIAVWAYLDEGSLGWKLKGEYGYTDDSGSYRIGGLAACNYRIEAKDYNNGDFVPRVYVDAQTLDEGLDVDLTVLPDATNVNISLLQAGKISGQVQLTNGIPLTDGYVNVRRWSGSSWNYVWSTGGLDDENGEYTIGGLPPGVYRVVFGAWNNDEIIPEWYNNALELEWGTDIEVVAGNTTSGINAVLDTPSWPPRIVRLSERFGSYEIMYIEKREETYILQTVADLDDGWVDVQTNTAFSTGVLTFWQLPQFDANTRFWRLRSPDAP